MLDPLDGNQMKQNDAIITFAPSQSLTLGVEVEVQLLDKETLDLTPKSPEIFNIIGGESGRVKAEIFQSMLEINTGICKNAHEIKKDLSTTMDQMAQVSDSLSIRMASSGTHPFALYSERIPYPMPRYAKLIDRNQWIARRLMIFGLHIHIGMRNGEHAIQMNNALLHHLPLLLALSASSPFWHGEDTELASSRITFFEALPTGGHPCRVNSWKDFSTLYSKMVHSGAIQSARDIWWDIRPSPNYGTLEIRICDGLPTLTETVALTALVHSLCIFIDDHISRGTVFEPPTDWIMRENKWRGSRWGTDAKLIINDDGDTEVLSKIVKDLLKDLKTICEQQNYSNEFALIDNLITRGASYKRQRVVSVQAGNNMKDVTHFLANEFEARTPMWYPQ